MRRDGGTARELAALRAEVEKLRAERDEAQETLRAIREGEVDAIVVSGTQGEQVFSLTGSESVYRLIVETMKEAALTVTTDGRILFCNGQFSAFVQTPPEQILGHPLTEFVAPDDRGLVAPLLAKSQEASVKQRLVFQGPDGPLVPAHLSATALCQTDSLSICLVATDLSELEASTELLRLLRTEQAALRASEEEFRAFFDNAAVGAVELGLDGRFLRVNDRYCDLTGFAREELLGMTPPDLAPPEDRAADQAQVAAYLRDPNRVFDVEERYLRKDGRVLWVRVNAAAIRDAAGRPLRSAGIVQDITARKQAQETLARTNAYRSDILQSIQDDFYVLNRDWTFAFASQRFTSRIGKAPKDFIGKNIWELFPKHVGTMLEEHFRATMAARETRRFELRGQYTEAWYAMTCFPSADGITVLGQDITERKRAEEALRNLNATLEQRVSDRTTALIETVETLRGEVAQLKQAEADLQETNRALRVLNASNEALVRIDDEPRLMQEICRIAVEIGGYRMAWVGMADTDADRSVRPVASTGFEAGYLEAARISWADTERGRGPTGTAIRLGQLQIGTDFLTEPRLAPWREEARNRGFRSSIALPLRQGETVFGVLTIYAAEPAAFTDAQVPVLQELADDLAFGLYAVRVRTALRESHDRVRALAGELTLAEQRERRRLADVLHDGLQQQLVAARLRAHMLARSPDAAVQASAHDLVALLEEAVAQTRSLAGELSPPALQHGHLLPALAWLTRWVGEKHHLTVHVGSPGASLPALPPDLAVLVYQSVRELLLNVVKYAQVDAAEVTLTQDAERVTCTVADAGVGFDPTTLRAAGGTDGGFGLLGIRERLDLVGGRLEIASAPGRGSRVTLVAPLGQAIAPPATRQGAGPAEAEPRSPAGRRLRVLVVDDHALVRRGFATLLAGEPDLEVVGEADNGQRAVELSRHLTPDVIVMDVSMPGMNGIDATRAILAEFPATRVIGLSMFDDFEQPEAMREAGAAVYLRKSDSVEALLAAIRGGGAPTA